MIGAKVIWDFLIDSVFARNNAETGSGKSKISKEITPILSEISDKIVQAHYANVVARKLGVPLDAVSEEIAKDQKVSTGAPSGIEEKTEGRTKREVLEENFLKLAFFDDPKTLASKEISVLIKLTTFKISEFGKNLPRELFGGFSKMVLLEERDLSEKPEELKKELELVKKELKILAVKEKLEILQSQIREMEEKGDKNKLLEAQNKFNKLVKMRSTYEKENGSGIILNED
ncbi:MAG: primase protein [Candidatus Woesebacteria bacterium GW2011_GWC2_40_30]|nr:MAG: primase protein [Candidatus Woesebacteria bacterium GW2011_GWC2_40_30]